MEDMNLIDDTTIEGGLNTQIKTYLMETAKWAKFIAITTVVIGGIMALVGIFAASAMANMAAMSGAPLGPVFFAVLYLIGAGLVIVPAIFLLNFATKGISALRSGNETQLTMAFQNLKSYYKFIGIMFAVVLGIYALALIAVMFTGALRGF
jgi:hypothetical protein